LTEASLILSFYEKELSLREYYTKALELKHHNEDYRKLDIVTFLTKSIQYALFKLNLRITQMLKNSFSSDCLLTAIQKKSVKTFISSNSHNCQL